MIWPAPSESFRNTSALALNMSDYEVERSVTDELDWDPRLDAKAIGVTADEAS